MSDITIDGVDLKSAFRFEDLIFRDIGDLDMAVLQISSGGENPYIVSLCVFRNANDHHFIGQMCPEDIGAEEFDLRNVRLFMHDFGIHGSTPASDNMIGPMTKIKVQMIIKLVQATVFDDLELKQQCTTDVNRQFADDEEQVSAPSRSGDVIEFSKFQKT